MPELPDVEYYRRYVNATALHHSISRVTVNVLELLEDTTPATLRRRLEGQAFSATRRHGKYLFIELDDVGYLVVHFGMTGRLQYFRQDRGLPAHTGLLLSFDNGFELAYTTTRKLGRIGITGSVEDYVASHRLGPDALAISLQQFLDLAVGHKGALKTWLTDQNRVAGIGNVYADEILFQARLHPTRRPAELSERELARLFRALRRVLRTAIRARAEPERLPGSFLLPHRDGDQHCPVCGGSLRMLSVAGRRACYCPTCQPAGVPSS